MESATRNISEDKTIKSDLIIQQEAEGDYKESLECEG